MVPDALARTFERMGSRVKMYALDSEPRRRRSRARRRPLAIDVLRDREGEYFQVVHDPRRVDLEVLQVKPKERHMLLMARFLDAKTKEKFLCGHDERHWFVAAVPDHRGVTDVRTAMEALMPPAVRVANNRRGQTGARRYRRRNPAHRRQGEWFFLPCPDFAVPSEQVLRHEPLQRGNGKPHMAELLYRTGGRTVYVCDRYPNGVGESEYGQIRRRDPEAWGWNWRIMRADPEVFVKGAVRHPDHKTIVLECWHRVYLNTESNAPAMRHVTFLD